MRRGRYFFGSGILHRDAVLTSGVIFAWMMLISVVFSFRHLLPLLSWSEAASTEVQAIAVIVTLGVALFQYAAFKRTEKIKITTEVINAGERAWADFEIASRSLPNFWLASQWIADDTFANAIDADAAIEMSNAAQTLLNHYRQALLYSTYRIIDSELYLARMGASMLEFYVEIFPVRRLSMRQIGLRYDDFLGFVGEAIANAQALPERYRNLTLE